MHEIHFTSHKCILCSSALMHICMFLILGPHIAGFNQKVVQSLGVLISQAKFAAFSILNGASFLGIIKQLQSDIFLV